MNRQNQPNDQKKRRKKKNKGYDSPKSHQNQTKNHFTSHSQTPQHHPPISKP